MDIKLRARLAAYTKMDSIKIDSDPDTVTREDIDSLFSKEIEPQIITKEHIDTLFVEEDEVATVSFADIDKLFQ